MRFSGAIMDRYKEQLTAIDDFDALEKFLDSINIKGEFLRFAAERDGIKPGDGEWAKTEPYLMPQLRATRSIVMDCGPTRESSFPASVMICS